MDLIEILWDLHQQQRIRDTEDRARDTGLTLGTVQSQLVDALDRLDHANLVMLALWELASEKLGLTLEQLRSKVSEIDLRDGTEDGRYAGETPACTGCGRKMPPQKQRCMYCGMRRRGLGLGDEVRIGIAE